MKVHKMNDATIILFILWFAPIWISIQRSNGRGAFEVCFATMLANIAAGVVSVVIAVVIKHGLPVLACFFVTYYFVFYKTDDFFASFVKDWFLAKK